MSYFSSQNHESVECLEAKTSGLSSQISTVSSNKYPSHQQKHISSADRPFQLMLFDLSIYGHHPGYIRYLMTHWHRLQVPCQLLIVVSPQFLVQHRDVVSWGETLDPINIKFIAIHQTEENRLQSRKNGLTRNLRNLQEWQIFCRYARRLKADHALLMYVDTYQYPLALRLNPPCSISGIYFRPTFHYKDFDYGRFYEKKVRCKQERFLLKAVLSNPNLDSLFTIDPLVIRYLDTQHTLDHKLVSIPDPVPFYSYSDQELHRTKLSLKIDSNRKIFLLFGALTERKGIFQLLDALSLLSKETCQKIAIVFIGEASPENKREIECRIATLGHLPIQFYCHYEFIPEDKIQAYFEVSDYVLALYQRHVGMSGILNIAAARQKPVLSSDYGLMGELVHQYSLGVAINSECPQEIATGIQNLLASKESKKNISKMKAFADQHSTTEFASTIFNTLLSEFRLKTN